MIKRIVKEYPVRIILIVSLCNPLLIGNTLWKYDTPLQADGTKRMDLHRLLQVDPFSSSCSNEDIPVDR